MTNSSPIFVAGHRGLVGNAILQRLEKEGHRNLITCDRSQLDLTRGHDVDRFFREHRPEVVFNAAAKVGGILANDTYPAEFIRDNLLIMINVIEASHRYGVRKVVLLGSSCVYPRLADQPIREDALLSGPLEATNQWYAIAKIAGIRAAQAYRIQYGLDAISLMPTNVYGPGDRFDLNNSHVVPALMMKFHEAVVTGASHVVVWGSGNPRREFLYVDDLAEACVFLARHYSSGELVNIGCGEDLTIRDLAVLMAAVTGFKGEIVFDATKPDGTPRKLLDSSRIRAMGWRPRTGLEHGLRRTYEWYLQSRGGKEWREPLPSTALGSHA